MLMKHDRFLKLCILALALTLAFILVFGVTTRAQFPTSYFFTNPLFYTDYGYFNSINGYLLGFAPFTPFLTPDAAYSYNSYGIPTFPYFGSPYETTFPYATLPGTPIPYARFDYPTYVYGDPSFYLAWTLLQ